MYWLGKRIWVPENIILVKSSVFSKVQNNFTFNAFNIFQKINPNECQPWVPDITFLSYQVLLYASVTITHLNAILWGVTEAFTHLEENSGMVKLPYLILKKRVVLNVEEPSNVKQLSQTQVCKMGLQREGDLTWNKRRLTCSHYR